MDTSVQSLFERYEQVFRSALRGELNIDDAARLYASEFIASSPAGLAHGKNDDQLKQVMSEGYVRYRAQGMKDMKLQSLRVSPIDDGHCVAHAAWVATYTRKDAPDIAIAFEVHYFVRDIGSDPKVFGWVAGDEQALLQQHGLL
jgi:hypothetical protein